MNSVDLGTNRNYPIRIIPKKGTKKIQGRIASKESNSTSASERLQLSRILRNLFLNQWTKKYIAEGHTLLASPKKLPRNQYLYRRTRKDREQRKHVNFSISKGPIFEQQVALYCTMPASILILIKKHQSWKEIM